MSELMDRDDPRYEVVPWFDDEPDFEKYIYRLDYNALPLRRKREENE